MLDLPSFLDQLGKTRPVFHSEADFQHALAWSIQTDRPMARVRLETRPERGIHLDLLVEDGGRRCAIELKYATRKLDLVVDGERFDLPSRGAHDITRYDFCKDVWRVEKMMRDGYADSGWAVLLTDDGGYWRPGTKADPIDRAFRLYEGRTVTGDLAWDDRAGARRQRRDRLSLTVTPLAWSDSLSPDGRGANTRSRRSAADRSPWLPSQHVHKSRTC